MASRPATIKQVDLTRYLRAWKAAGYSEPKAEIRADGTVILLPITEPTGDGKNDWD